MFVDMKAELMRHAEACVSMAMQDDQEHSQEEDAVSSPGGQFVMELDNSTSGNDEIQAASQHGESSTQLEDLAQEFSISEKSSPGL